MLFEALKSKQELATYMVTQMCFDPRLLLHWLQAMRDQGITLPVWLGLPGVMSRVKLLQTALRIGVGESTRFARKHSSLAGQFLRSASYTPDALVLDLSVGVRTPGWG